MHSPEGHIHNVEAQDLVTPRRSSRWRTWRLVCCGAGQRSKDRVRLLGAVQSLSNFQVAVVLKSTSAHSMNRLSYSEILSSPSASEDFIASVQSSSASVSCPLPLRGAMSPKKLSSHSRTSFLVISALVSSQFLSLISIRLHLHCST